MRVLLLLCLHVLSVTNGFTQEKKWNFGITIGENTTWITSDLHTSPRISMQAGDAIEYSFNKKLSLQTRLAYSPLLATVTEDRFVFGSGETIKTTYKFSLESVEGPILLSYRWPDIKRFKFAIGVGGHARYFMKSSFQDTNKWTDSSGEHKWELRFDLSDDTKKFAFLPAIQTTADFKLNDKRNLRVILSYSRSTTSILPKSHLYYVRGTGDINFNGYLGKNYIQSLSLITQITF